MEKRPLDLRLLRCMQGSQGVIVTPLEQSKEAGVVKLEFHAPTLTRRHGHPREDPRRHVRHARFPEVIPMARSTTRRHSRDDPREDVGVGVVESQL